LGVIFFVCGVCFVWLISSAVDFKMRFQLSANSADSKTKNHNNLNQTTIKHTQITTIINNPRQCGNRAFVSSTPFPPPLSASTPTRKVVNRPLGGCVFGERSKPKTVGRYTH
jgi:hypothetical protein